MNFSSQAFIPVEKIHMVYSYKLLKGFEGESAGLGEKFQRVVVDDLADQRFRVASPAHDGDEFGHGQRIGRIPVGRGVY